MSDRRVTNTGKDRSGDITKLCNLAQEWSPRSKEDVISDIEKGIHTYYVLWTDKRTEIHVVLGQNGKYLRTDWDNTRRNNLDDLPDC